jgi:thioester reductase-like protein
MKILLTGSTGYIAQRLLPVLLNRGDEGSGKIFCPIMNKLIIKIE